MPPERAQYDFLRAGFVFLDRHFEVPKANYSFLAVCTSLNNKLLFLPPLWWRRGLLQAIDFLDTRLLGIEHSF